MPTDNLDTKNYNILSKKPIPPKLWQSWRMKMELTTKTRIHQEAKLSRPVITWAINDGLASEATMGILTKYFDDLTPTVPHKKAQ